MSMLSDEGISRSCQQTASNESSASPSELELDDNGLTPDLIESGYVDVTPEKDGGVLKLVVKNGISSDLPTAEDYVFINYVGTLRNGHRYDSSQTRSKPFTFMLGKGSSVCD